MSIKNVSVDIIYIMVHLWRTEQDCSKFGKEEYMKKSQELMVFAGGKT